MQASAKFSGTPTGIVKSILIIVLAIFCTINVRAWQTIESSDTYLITTKKIEEVRKDREDRLKRRKTIKEPQLLAENERIIAELTTIQQLLEGDIKKMRSHLNINRPCPVCGGKLVRVDSVRDSSSKPSKNFSVWRRGKQCLISRYVGGSPVCTRCWFAQSLEGGEWSRYSDNRDAFFHPFCAALRNFPLPDKEHLFYEQRFQNGKRSEQMSFSFDGSKDYLEKAQAYARDNALNFELVEFPVQEIRVSTKVQADTSGK